MRYYRINGSSPVDCIARAFLEYLLKNRRALVFEARDSDKDDWAVASTFTFAEFARNVPGDHVLVAHLTAGRPEHPATSHWLAPIGNEAKFQEIAACLGPHVDRSPNFDVFTAAWYGIPREFWRALARVAVHKSKTVTLGK